MRDVALALLASGTILLLFLFAQPEPAFGSLERRICLGTIAAVVAFLTLTH